MTSSTFMYCKEKGSLTMPSLTPRPNGLDKSKITRHFPGWYFFGTTPKRLKAWNSRYRAGASYATFLKFCEDTLINHRRVKRRWWHILGRKPQQYRWRIKAKKKTNSNTRNHKIHFSLIRVKTKFPRQFICNKGGGGNSKRRDQILLNSTSNGIPCGGGDRRLIYTKLAAIKYIRCQRNNNIN